MNATEQKKTEGESGGNCGCKGKWIWWGVGFVVVVAIAVSGYRRSGNAPATEGACCGGSAAVVVGTGSTEGTPPMAVSAPVPPVQALPRLVDLGAGKCIPCKMMAPILEELKKTYAGKLDVQFIDVWVNPDEAPKYGIKIIPTQIFYDAVGKELFRHEGFFAREDILAKWKACGVNLTGAAPTR